MGEHLTIAVVMVTLITAITFILKTLIEGISRAKVARAQADVMSRMIDRFGSSQELVAYLHSESGRRFIETVPEGKSRPHHRLLNSVQGGAVLSILGAGVMATQSFVRDSDGRDVAMGVGLIIMTLGLGLLVSAGAAWYMSRSWGLLNGQSQQ